MGFRMVNKFLTPGDLQRSKVKVNHKNFKVEYIENGTSQISQKLYKIDSQQKSDRK